MRMSNRNALYKLISWGSVYTVIVSSNAADFRNTIIT
jgi:hypothetical protein